MDQALLQQGLAALGIDLPLERQRRLMLYLREMLRWNRRVNLTAITDEGQAVEKHLLDSLTLLPLLEGAGDLLDIGSGGGLPALPLKIVRPELEVVSVDAVQKKILFQRHVARLLGLDAFHAVHGRIEELVGTTPFDRHFSMITSRALSDLETFVGWAKPFSGPGTRIVAMKGRDGERELENSRKAIEDQGVVLRHIHRVSLPFSGSVRCLLVFANA